MGRAMRVPAGGLAPAPPVVARRYVPHTQQLGSLVAPLLCVLAATAHGQTPAPASQVAATDRTIVYHVDPLVDGALVGGGATLWILPFLVVGNTIAGPRCDPCNPRDLNALDRRFVKYHNEGARTGAAAMWALPGLLVLGDFLDVGPRRWRGWSSDLVVIAESLVWDGALQEVVRYAVRRPRPFMYAPGVRPKERVTPEATLSFYSGHTSSMFTVAVAFSLTYTLRHPDGVGRYIVWPVTLALAAVEPILRVASGDHFPTDVLVGALMGSAVGLLVPALHRVRRDAVRAWVVPATDGRRTTLSLIAGF
jgi:membrane-associated phospholipid phosphatase